jgi:hypothetical protein
VGIAVSLFASTGSTKAKLPLLQFTPERLGWYTPRTVLLWAPLQVWLSGTPPLWHSHGVWDKKNDVNGGDARGSVLSIALNYGFMRYSPAWNFTHFLSVLILFC